MTTTESRPGTESVPGTDHEATCTLQFVVTKQKFCTAPAEWACQLACCGHLKVVCGPHRDIVASTKPKVFICNRCGTTRPGIARAWRI